MAGNDEDVPIFNESTGERPLFRDALNENAHPNPKEVFITLEDFNRLFALLRKNEELVIREMEGLDEECDHRVRVVREDLEARIVELERGSNVGDTSEEGTVAAEEELANLDASLGSYVLTHEHWISPFKGDGPEIFSNWVVKLEDLMDLATTALTAEQKAMRLKFHLDGLARAYFNQLPDNIRTDFDLARASLKQKFEGERTKLAAENSLATLAQNSTVGQLALDVSDLVFAAMSGDTDDQLKKRRLAEFVKKLSPDIRFQVKLADPDTFEEAAELAAKVEGLIKEKGEKRDQVTEKLDGLAKMLSGMGSNGGTGRLANDNFRATQRNELQPPRCHYCGIFGHLERDCRQRQRVRINTQATKCYSCGKLGHISRFCQSSQNFMSSSNAPQVNQFMPRFGRTQGQRFGNAQVNRGGFRQFGLPNSGNANAASGGNTAPIGNSFSRPTASGGGNGQQNRVNVIDIPKPSEDVMKVGGKAKEQELEREIIQLRAAKSQLERQNETLGSLFNNGQRNAKPGSKMMVNCVQESGKKGTMRYMAWAFVITILLAFTRGSVGMSPMLCQGLTSPALWKIPSPSDCGLPDFRGNPKKVAMDIFRPNLKTYQTEGSLCSHTRTDFTIATNLIGEEEILLERIMFLSTSRDECERMIFSRKCRYGELTDYGPNRLDTNNTIVLDYPTRWESLFGEPRVRSVFNCHLISHSVNFEYGADSITSSAGLTNHCRYEKGGCTVIYSLHSFVDKETYLWWKVDKDALCAFLDFARWDGTVYGPVWFAKNEEFALTFSKEPKIIYDCGKKLVISDKKFAVLEKGYLEFLDPRHKREANNSRVEEGIIFSGQQSAALQALEEVTRELVQFAFSKAALSICEAENESWKKFSAIAAGNPTLAARAMLQNEFLQARLLTGDILEVWPCTPISKAQISINRKEIGGIQCLKFLPVTVELNSKKFDGFIDPITRIVARTSPVGPCDQNRFITTEWFGSLIAFDQISGLENEIDFKNLKEIGGFNFEFTLPEPVIFHSMIIYNISDYFPSQHFEIDEGERTTEIRVRKMLPEFTGEMWALNDLKKVSAQIVKDGLFGFLVGLDFSLVQFWVFCCCGYVTIKLALPLIWYILIILYPQLTFLTHFNGVNRSGRWNNDDFGISMNEFRRDGPTIEELDEFGLTVCNQRRTRQNPRLSVKNGVISRIIGACDRTSLEWSPVLNITMGGIKIKALVDTGAAISLINLSILDKIEEAIIHPVKIPVQCIGGQIREISGALVTTFSGPGFEFLSCCSIADWPLFIEKYGCTLLLGRDLLRKMPPIVFNLRNHYVSFLDYYPNGSINVGILDDSEILNWEEGELAHIGAIDWKKPEVKTLVENYVMEAMQKRMSKGDRATLRIAVSRELGMSDNELVSVSRLANIIRYTKLMIKARVGDATIKAVISHLENNETEKVEQLKEVMKVKQLAVHDEIGSDEAVCSSTPTINMVTWNECSPTPTFPKVNAQVVGQINGVSLPLLLDTGSQVTIGSISLTSVLGIEKLDPIRLDMVGVGGQLIGIKGSCVVKITVGGYEKETRMYFSDKKPAAKSSEFEAIIGVDVLAQFPPVTFDFGKWNISIGKEKVQLGVGRNCEGLLAHIRILDSVIIPPNCEMVVEGYIPENFGTNVSSWFIERESEGLQKKLLGTLPTVTELSLTGKCPFLIINPTQNPVKIYEDSSLALATKIQDEIFVKSGAGVFVTTVCERDPEFVVDLDKAGLSEENKGDLRLLLSKFDDIFSKNSHDLGVCKVTAPTIVTTSETPPKQRPFRAPFKLREEIRSHIDKLIKMGVMRVSDTPWVSNLVLVAKKDGSLRPCIDFRKLNSLTVPDYFPLPRIETVLEKIGGCSFYSSLDLSSGYMQIPLDKETSYKCGVITEDGTYQMEAMPFGLKNASGIFSRTMSKVLYGLDEAVISYIDDILIFTKSNCFDVHLESLEKVFLRLREFGLKLSPKKCLFARDEIPFLGHVIRCNDYAPAPRNIVC
jgi:hypothetical protein